MKIGLFSDQYYPQVSGVVTSITILYDELVKLGHECYIVTLTDTKGHEDSPYFKNYNVVNFNGKYYPFKACKEYKFNWTHKKFLKQLKELNLDIIHINTEFDIAKTAKVASKKLHIPVVYTVHTAWINYICTLFPKLDKLFHPILVCMMRHMFTKPSYKMSEQIILPTKKMIPDLKPYGIKGTNYSIIPTGIDLNKFARNKYTEEEILNKKKELGLDNKFVYVYIGRTAKEKNIPTVIEAYAKAHKDNDKARLLIVGGGPELDNLKAEANKLEITDKVEFTGLIPFDDVPIYYHLGDVFVNASKSETQGLTYIEALASGLPNLVQWDLCIDDVIKDGYNGYIFNNMDEFVEKLKYSFENQNINDELKINAYNSSKEYSKEQFATKILEVYESAIKKYKEKREKK